MSAAPSTTASSRPAAGGSVTTTSANYSHWSAPPPSMRVRSTSVIVAFQGGWLSSFGHGNVSRANPDAFARNVESLLRDELRADMRAKLAASELSTRIAALVFDSTTAAGWATSHVADGPPPPRRSNSPRRSRKS
jgi:hypothetical protein